jgi:hypothetical protein
VRVSAADAAWNLLRSGAGHHDEAAEIALGLVGDPTASPDDVAKAGTLLLAMQRYPDAVVARDRALQAGAAPTLLAYLDPSCRVMVDGDYRGARRAFATHLAEVPDPVHRDLPGMASDLGAPMLAWKSAGRAGFGVRERFTLTARAAFRRAPGASNGLRGPAL